MVNQGMNEGINETMNRKTGAYKPAGQSFPATGTPPGPVVRDFPGFGLETLVSPIGPRLHG